MIFFLIVLLLLALFLEGHMGRVSLERLSCSLRCREYLVEPGETFTPVFTVENRSRMPVLFLRCSFGVPCDAALAPGERGQISNYVNYARYSFTCFLMPRQKLERRVKMTMQTRGGYWLGSIQLSAGDFLGMKEQTADFPGGCNVVILPRRPEGGMPEAVFGGLMGEHSVRRWLHEDPILSAGFREYTGREPLKAISWNRSLQSGQWMVRQMDHTSEERITVLLSMNSGTWEDREAAFRVCRGVCELLESRKLAYAFLHNGMLLTAVGVLPPVEAGLGANHLNRILEGLGRAVPEVTGDLDMLIRKALARRQELSCYLLIVPIVTPEVRRKAKLLEQQTGGTVEIISGEGIA